MTDALMRKWAEALTGFSVVVEPGETVVISAGLAAEPLAREVYRAVLRRGGFPVMFPRLSGPRVDLLTLGNDAQIEYISPIERWIEEEADVNIHIMADSNTRALSGVDPARISQFSRARADLIARFDERAAAGEAKWTLTLFPTDAFAQDAEMSTADYAEFVYSACKLDADDPIAAWQEQKADNQRLIDWLTPRGEVHIVAPGTDFHLSVGGRTWENAYGTENFPDGEVFTGPVETSANGHVTFTYPAIYNGNEVDGVRLRFEAGKVVDATASKGEPFLIQTLDTDAGARFLGEFAFGTNFGVTRFVKEMLFDEKIGGTLHMALGSGYPATGSVNKSSVHWDMLLDVRRGGTVTVDGDPFLVDGRYVV